MFDERNSDRMKDSGGASYIYGTVAELRSLLSGGWVDVDPKFSIEDMGAHLARVRVIRKPDGTESFELELLGADSHDKNGYLEVNESNIDFGAVPVRTVREIPFIITNNGPVTIEINKISKIGTDASVFSISGIGTPFKVLPGLMVQVNLHFVPDREGPYAAALRIETSAEEEADLVITLAGEGVGSESIVDQSEDDKFLIELLPNPANVGDTLHYRYSGTAPIHCGIVVYDAFAHELYSRYRFDLLPGENPLPVPLDLDGGKYFFRFLLPHTQRILPLEMKGKKKRPRGRPRKKRW